jgi:hypothetical protein
VSREDDAVPAIRAVVASGTEVHADEAGAWNSLHASFPLKRVNHSVGFKADGRSVHQLGRKLLLPAAPLRVRHSSLEQRPFSPGLRERTRVARGQTVRRKRDAMALGHQRGPRAGKEYSPGGVLAWALGVTEHRLKAHRRACRNRLYHRRSGTQTCATSRRSDAYRWRVARSRERPGPGDDSPEAYLSPHPVFRSQRTRAVVLTPAALVPWLNGHRLAPRRQEKRGNRILSHALSRATARRTVPRQRFLR